MRLQCPIKLFTSAQNIFVRSYGNYRVRHLSALAQKFQPIYNESNNNNKYSIRKHNSPIHITEQLKPTSRCYSIQKRYGHTAATLPHTRELIGERVFLILRLFDKIDPEKVRLDAHFIKDLGMDSLDQVELIVELENEFFVDIPDEDGERLWTPRQCIDYFCDKFDVFV